MAGRNVKASDRTLDRTLASNIILGVSSTAEQTRFKYIDTCVYLKMRIDHGNSNLLPQLFLFFYVPYKKQYFGFIR